MTDLVIETTGLQQSIRPKVAVADLTLQVPRGEVFGFLGPNGAGKSTSVKMLLGLVAPSGGDARVLGQPPGDPAAMARVGFLPEHFRFHEWLQAAELLDLHGRLYGMDAADPPPAHPRAARTGRPGRARPPADRRLLQGHAPAHRAGPGAAQRSRAGVSRRADLGARSVRAHAGARDHSRSQGARHHGVPELAPARRGRGDLRPGLVHQGRPRAAHPGAQRIAAGQLQVELRVDAITPALLAALEQTIGDAAWCRAWHDAGDSSAPATCHLTLADEELLPLIAERILASGARLYALTPRRMSLEQLFLEVVGTEDSGQ